ncbi:MAG: VCBS repeat-containing protein [Bacteroidia bacterium]|nr:VCBS repeat-containing protein [Bacteroidia bacterium]
MRKGKQYRLGILKAYLLSICLLGLGVSSCESGKEEGKSLFTLMPADSTGVDFSNDVEYTPEFNMYTYRNFYNGGGVGMGDINNDGLADLFFCGNLKDNKLYLNKGNFEFEDISEQAGVAAKNVWSTGVAFADVNGDGWLDIYVNKSGRPGGDKRHNELFINNGDLTFTEQAHEYGIADEGLSSHSAFFDYDKDGDLDMYLLNNSFRPVGGYDIRPGLREKRDSLGGNKLYRNDSEFDEEGKMIQGKFTDVSEEAGIYGSDIGFGLGVTIGDVDRDGWQDIFVSNDFFERDYLYINQKDGSFKEDLVNQIRETSMGSMGADMADINNDGYPEIFVTEMLPEKDARYKTKMTFEDWDKYQLNVKNGYHHQFTRNVLQLNNGDGSFSEIGRLAGVHATDWSWSALMADFDNDGKKDIYVSNGIYKDLLDQDYINFHSNDPKIIQAIKNKEKDAILKLIDIIPSERIPNYAFKNEGDLKFENVTENWGLSVPSHSNGSIYGDLDNDGDLDIVVNNSNMPAFLFRNESQSKAGTHFLELALEGEGPNRFALGAQVSLKVGDETLYQELAPMRGFQSCIDQKLHFGLGDSTRVEKIEVLWPDGRMSVLENLEADQLLIIRQSEAEAKKEEAPEMPAAGLFSSLDLIDHRHIENDFIDFDRDPLIYHMLSSEGPKMAKADVNGDGLEDFFIGGASGQAGSLFIQEAEGIFTKSNTSIFERDRNAEDIDMLFFDADGDRDMDLYVVSGGNEFKGLMPQLLDRLYLNDGSGNFSRSPQRLPGKKIEAGSSVKASDIDADGDQDLFVGTRLKPGIYGVAVSGYLLENDGKGQFTDVTETKAPELRSLGMITDALWMDLDGDNDEDLIVLGEWMPVSIFENEDGRLKNITEEVGLENSNGFYNVVKAADLDNDGDLDLVLGNLGLNSRFKASEEKPMSILVNDFDGNKTPEQIISMYNGEEDYPLALRHDLTMQMPGLKKKYLYYENYKEQRVEDIFEEKAIRTAAKSYVYETRSMIAWNEGGEFRLEALPQAAQMAPVFAIDIADRDGDGNLDILLGGNFYRSKPEIGIYDASYGLLLLGDAKGEFYPLSSKESGIKIRGEVRDFLQVNVGGKNILLVARNHDAVLALSQE